MDLICQILKRNLLLIVLLDIFHDFPNALGISSILRIMILFDLHMFKKHPPDFKKGNLDPKFPGIRTLLIQKTDLFHLPDYFFVPLLF